MLSQQMESAQAKLQSDSEAFIFDDIATCL